VSREATLVKQINHTKENIMAHTSYLIGQLDYKKVIDSRDGVERTG